MKQFANGYLKMFGLVDESKLDLRMRKESSRMEQDCVSAKIRISLAGVDFFHTDKQRHNLIAGLQGPTSHGYERLLDCVSFLIEQTAWQKSNSKHEDEPVQTVSVLSTNHRDRHVQLCIRLELQAFDGANVSLISLNGRARALRSSRRRT